MKRIQIGLTLILALCIAGLAACGTTAGTVIEMELTQHYDTSDPFVSEKLIYVSADIDSVLLDASVQLDGEAGTLEIADNQTGEVFWSESWSGTVDGTQFSISLDALERDREYVVRFTGNKISYAKVTITSEDSLIKEREMPLKPNKV